MTYCIELFTAYGHDVIRFADKESRKAYRDELLSGLTWKFFDDKRAIAVLNDAGDLICEVIPTCYENRNPDEPFAHDLSYESAHDVQRYIAEA